MKTLVVLLALSALSSDLPAAPPTFDFKGNTLGMSLANFRRANMATGWISIVKKNLIGLPVRKSIEVRTPLCTDELRDFPGDVRDLVDDEVLCNASPGTANYDGLTINGDPVTSVTYRFYKLRLYQIEIRFPIGRFDEIATAFTSKYGSQTSTSFSDHQNTFGAAWQGRIDHWTRGTALMAIGEGSGAGPEQDGLEPSVAAFRETTLQPPTPKPAIDF